MMKRIIAAAVLAVLASAGAASAKATDMTATIAGRHMAKGVQCQMCHPVQKNAIEWRNCVGCHGGEDGLAKQSPIHNMVKHGKTNCAACHKGH